MMPQHYIYFSLYLMLCANEMICSCRCWESSGRWNQFKVYRRNKVTWASHRLVNYHWIRILNRRLPLLCLLCFFSFFIFFSVLSSSLSLSVVHWQSINQLYICILPSAACVDAALVQSMKAIYSSLILSVLLCVTQIMSEFSNVLQLFPNSLFQSQTCFLFVLIQVWWDTRAWGLDWGLPRCLSALGCVCWWWLRGSYDITTRRWVLCLYWYSLILTCQSLE